MKISWHEKTRLWQIAWLGSAIALALTLGWHIDRPAACRMEELTSVPDDTNLVGVQAVQGNLEGTVEALQKRVYLTFDDGPSPTTETVLDILKEEQVPATFFVIAAPNNEEWLPILQRTQAEGHQIALHSCCHEYKEIYRSPAAFWADIRDLKQQLKPYVQDVEAITWLRFPGGSTNTVSHKYGGSNIMSSLKRQAEEKGYHYVDWNVCANDAVGGHPNADTILHNVIDGVGDKTSCVVLMHDTKATRTTAQALPEIIHWFKENGFEFCTIQQLTENEE